MVDLTRKELAAIVRETKRRSREGEQPLDVLAALLDPPAPKPEDFGEIRAMTEIEPRLIPTAVEHRVDLQCTPRDLRLLADLADAALAQRSGCHIHVVSLCGVCIHFTLDRDRAVAERVKL